MNTQQSRKTTQPYFPRKLMAAALAGVLSATPESVVTLTALPAVIAAILAIRPGDAEAGLNKTTPNPSYSDRSQPLAAFSDLTVSDGHNYSAPNYAPYPIKPPPAKPGVYWVSASKAPIKP